MVVDVKKIVDRKINMMQLVLASEMSYLYYLYKENCPLRLRNKEEIVVMRNLNKKMTLSDLFYNTVGGMIGGLMYYGITKAKKHL